MSVVKVDDPHNRGKGILVGTHPRANGELILTPDDIMEGQGNFAIVDADGNPDGWVLVDPPVPDARNVYGGTSAADVTRQNSAPLSLDRSSYLVNHPLVDGDPLPQEGDRLAPLPRPRAPKVKKVKIDKAGYQPGTSTNPHWIAFSWGVQRPKSDKIDHTELGPATSFTGANGQSYRVTLPERAPEGVTHVGVWMALGSTSTSTRPGDFFLQRDLDLAKYGSPFYDLNGPYRFQEEEPSQNETTLPKGERLRSVRFRKTNIASRIGTYWFKLAWARGAQEGLPGPEWGPYTVEGSDYYADPDTPIGDIPELLAGYGVFDIKIPRAPRDVTGFFLYVMVGDEWSRAYDKVDGTGQVTPWPLKQNSIEVAGWGPGSDFGENDRVLLAGQDPQTTDESGIEAPDFRPELPEPFGAARPEPGVYFFRTTDELRGIESKPSPAAEVELGFQDVARVVFRSPVNDLPNSTYVEKAADGLPLDHVITQNAGLAFMEGGELVLETNGVQTSPTATPTSENEPEEVDHSKRYQLIVRLNVKNPRSGSLQGTVEAILDEITSTGVVTSTVLITANREGEHEVKQVIDPDTGSGFKWRNDTAQAKLRVRFNGASRNAIVRVSRQLLKPYKWDIRRRKKRPGQPANPNPPPETTHPPGSDIGLEPSPSPPEVPETFEVPGPDRPLSSGDALEDLSTFDAAMPAGWTEHTSGGATIARTTGAALSGTNGLLLQKSSAGALGSAFISKVFPVPAGLLFRHDAAFSTRNRVAALSGSEYLEMHKIAQPNGDPVAWLRYGNARELATLTIDSAPITPGTVQVSLDGVVTNIAVTAVREVARLSLTGPPTSPGTIGITLGGVTRQITAGGVRESFRLEITTTPYASGYVGVTLDGATVSTYIRSSYTRADVAAYIGARPYPGWNVRSSGRFIYFEAQLPGSRNDPIIGPGPTGIGYAIAEQVQGSSETAAQLADRIRATQFTGWTPSGTAGSTTIDFTAVEGGPRTDASVDFGTTGALGTMTTITQGGLDTATELATRIRGTTFANWTTGGSARIVTFLHNSAGARQGAQFSAGTTGTEARITTTVQGALGDLIAYVRDRNGVERKRKIMAGLGTTTIWNVDVAVMGAGTPYAIVAFWGSTATGQKLLLAYFEYVDLTDVAVGYEGAGVFADSSTSATWTVHVDDLAPTSRGDLYYRTHDYAGTLLNQLHYHGVPNQPTIRGMPLSGFRGPVLPGEVYSFSGFYRWEGVPENKPARPTFITAYSMNGETKRLLDITGATGLSGDGAWQELKLDQADAIQIPNDCHLIGIESKNVTEGTIVMQELVYSLGTQVKRTPLKQLSGNYRATFRRRAAAKPSWVFYSERRRLLETDIEVEENATAIVRYRAGDTDEGPWDPYEEDPTLIRDREYVEIDVQGTSEDGVATFVVRDGAPKLEYDVVMGDQKVTSFLLEDGSELFGGALTIDPDEWSAIPDVGVNRLPGGALQRTKLFEGVETLPGTSIVCFTEQDKRYIEERCLVELFRREEWGESLLIALSGQVRFERQSAKRLDRDGIYKCIYVAQLPPAQVIQRQRLA